MSAKKPGTAEKIPAPQAVADPYQQAYERLLTLADKVQAAYAAAYEQVSAAWAEAVQSLAFDATSLQATLAGPGLPDWRNALAFGASAPSDQSPAAKDRTLAVEGDLTELSRTVTVACLDAGEKAALAAVEAYESMAADSPVEVVKTTATKHADLARQFTQAGVGAVRQLVA